MRHFYFLFFQIVLVIIFLVWFVNVIGIIDVSRTENVTTIDRILKLETINGALMVFLMLLNSFWMLYMFNIIQRLLGSLKDINYNINRLRFQNNNK